MSEKSNLGHCTKDSDLKKLQFEPTSNTKVKKNDLQS